MSNQDGKSRRGREPILTVRQALRLKPEEMALIDAVRDRCQEIFPHRKISRSEVIRMMISETGDALAEHLATASAVGDQTEVVEKFTQTIDLLQGVDVQLQRLGNNVNQVAKCLNSGAFTREDAALFSGFLDEIREVRVSLDRVQVDVYGRDPYKILRQYSWLS